MKFLILIAGAPGSGKSTLANEMIKIFSKSGTVVHYEADQYFGRTGVYEFDPKRIPDAHKACKENVLNAMRFDVDTIIVANTFTEQWERIPYLSVAKESGYIVHFVHLVTQYKNIHGVPDNTVEKMKLNFEPFSNI